MKIMNKKGFTLVELLVVLVILVVIMSIAIPSVTSSIERSKQKQKDSKIEMILSAAEIYVDRHKNEYSGNTTYTIPVSKLICDKLLTKEQVKDPFNQKYTLGIYVNYNKSSNSFSFSNSTLADHRYLISDTLTCSDIIG